MSLYNNGFYPTCIKCVNIQPYNDSCKIFGRIPNDVMNMIKECDVLEIEKGKELISVGNRELTLLERMAVESVKIIKA